MGHWGGQGAMRDVATQPWRGRDAARRHMVPTRGFSTLALILVALSAAGCTYKPTVRPSQGHKNTEQLPPKAASDKILPPLTVCEFVPPPKPQVKVPTYSGVVQEVPVKELLFALSRDAKQNIDV